MRTFDFAPLHRATIGFDQVTTLLDRVMANDAPQSAYPPYNIEKTADDAYRISIAVAGFSESDLAVEVKENSLVISAKKVADETGRTYLHRGIATRAFERRFTLADHVRVTGASHVDGMLHIDLQREVPEALKSRRISISGTKAIDQEVVEAKTVN